MHAASASSHEKQGNRGQIYLGSFNPFSDTASVGSSQAQRYAPSPVDDERKVSRFGFARGRQSSTTASSPLQSITPLTYGNDHQPFFHLSDEVMNTWSGLPDLHAPNSHTSSSVTQQDQVQASFPQHQQRLPPVHGNGELSEAQLRNFILSNQERDSGSTNSHNVLGTRESSPFINILPLNFSISTFTVCRFATNTVSAVSTFRGPCNYVRKFRSANFRACIYFNGIWTSARASSPAKVIPFTCDAERRYFHGQSESFAG